MSSPAIRNVRSHFLIGVVFSAVIASAAAVQAQGARGGLFGGARSDTGEGNRFNVTFGLSEAYDTEVPGEFRHRVPQGGLQSGGFSTMLTTSAEYTKVGRRTQVTGNGETALRYYQKLGEVEAVSHSVALGGRLNVSRNGSIEINQTAAYSPLYMFQLFPGVTPPELGDAVPTASEFRVDQSDSFNYGTKVSVALGSARSNRFTTSADYRHTDHQGQSSATRPDLTTYGARAGYSRGIGRNSSIAMEYEYQTGDFQFASADEHRLSVTTNYSRALSASRRATFRFTVSPSMIDIPESSLEAVVTGRVARLQAEGSVDYGFHRLWQAGASYRRATEFLPGFTEPVFADSASAQISGLITRRVDVAASAGYAQGGSALTGQRSQIDTYTGTARLRVALTRALAVYTEYVYYFYELRGETSLAPGLPPRFEQQGVRLGLMLWVPVF